MSLALKLPDAALDHDVELDNDGSADHDAALDHDAGRSYSTGCPPLRFSTHEDRLRNQFVAAFNDARQPGLALYVAVRDVTDDLKRAGALPETVVKRIKYIAAIPIAFHYRVGYKGNRNRLKDTMSKAISISIERYFA
jgi:hypothetical protein